MRSTAMHNAAISMERPAHDAASADQPHRGRIDGAFHHRGDLAATGDPARIGVRRNGGGEPRRRPVAEPNRRAICGAGNAFDAGVLAGRGADPLERCHAVRRAGAGTLSFAALALQGRARCAAVVRRLAGAAGVGAGDRLPGRQAGGARKCLARGAGRLGLCAAPGRRRGGVARGAQRAGVLARRPRGQAVRPDCAGAEPVAGRPLRRCFASAAGHRSGHDRRRIQPHGGAAAGPHRDRTARGTGRNAALRQPRADALDRSADRGRTARHRARTAR